MKRYVRASLAILVALGFIFVMVGCGSGSTTTQDATKAGTAAANTAAETKPIKLTAWINGSDSYIGPEEQKKPQEEWYISQAFKRFEEQNPGVTIELTVPPDQAQAHQTFKAAALAGNAPDIVNLWTGVWVNGLKDVIAPLDGIMPAEDLSDLNGWEGVKDADGKILAYPCGDYQIWYFLYNKEIISKAGLDFEKNPPKTTQEFTDALTKIKGTGATPLVMNESFPWFWVNIGDYWWIQQSGKDRLLSSCEGKTKFVDDQGLISALKYYKSLYDNGLINQDAVTSTDAWNQFLQGKAAMHANITTVLSDAVKTLGDKVGIIKPPDMPGAQITGKSTGGVGQCLAVWKDSPNVEMAVKFLHYLNSKEEVLNFMKVQQKIPTRKDVTAADMSIKPGSVFEKLYGWREDGVFFVDNTLSPSVIEQLYKLPTLVLTGKMTPEQMAAEFDKAAAASE